MSPGLKSDPAQLFSAPEPILLQFDQPLNPELANVSDQTFRLIDIENGGSLSLGVEVQLLDNRFDGSIVQVQPTGILPFGHMLVLEIPVSLAHVSQTSVTSGNQVVATFTVEDVPGGVTTIEDEIKENFDDTEHRDPDFTQIANGILIAEWDEQNSNVLQASIAVQGGGLLGRFAPPAPLPGQSRQITLDTNTQPFPLLDGSTGDAPSVVITGGVFPFTDIDIPAGIRLVPVGSNPLVLTATGSVHIAGAIDVNGQPGISENAYDSAVTSIPGGNGIAGGGRGGESHPILYFPPTQPSAKTLVSPRFAGNGWGSGNQQQIGGEGGECGTVDNDDPDNPDPNNPLFATDIEIVCDELNDAHNNVFKRDRNGNFYLRGYKPPGGGGGSHFELGGGRGNPNASRDNQNGRGNVISDGLGGYIARANRSFLFAGKPGLEAFRDNDPNNNFVGRTGELTEVIAGQGGGGGGSALDSYYCGGWCRLDSDTTNDSVCQDEFGGVVAGPVGDSRGGSAGAGGGAIVIRALGDVDIASTARLTAIGGQGGGGEAIGCSQWAGAGGSGSGGAVIIESGTTITIASQAQLWVTGGAWRLARAVPDYVFPCSIGRATVPAGDVPGDGGIGGHGLIQLQTPALTTSDVPNPTNSIRPTAAWADPTNTMNPSGFSPISVALSGWFDMGQVTQRLPANTNPVYEFTRNGKVIKDGNSPFVETINGFVKEPDLTDIVCDYLGKPDPEIQGAYLEPPQKDFIPSNATVKIEFQGGRPIAPGSKEVDTANLTAWSASPEIANSLQFLRYRITFDVTADGSVLGADTRLPVVQSLKVKARF
jgi:hypothetical protein